MGDERVVDADEPRSSMPELPGCVTQLNYRTLSASLTSHTASTAGRDGALDAMLIVVQVIPDQSSIHAVTQNKLHSPSTSLYTRTRKITHTPPLSSSTSTVPSSSESQSGATKTTSMMRSPCCKETTARFTSHEWHLLHENSFG